MNDELTAQVYDALLPGVAGLFSIDPVHAAGSRDKAAVSARRVVAHVMIERHSKAAISRAMRCKHSTVVRLMQAQLSKVEEVAIAMTRTVAESPQPPVVRAVGGDRDRLLFDEARRQIAGTVLTVEKQAIWERACRVLYPYSFEAQAARLPRC